MYKADLRGQKFGRLTVIDYVGTVNRKALWLCKCECGNETVLETGHIKSGHTRSCGCILHEIRKERKALLARYSKTVNIKHNGCKERLYGVWARMTNRCENPNNSAYKWYGERGIKVCAEWHDYATFREWAVSTGYDPTAEIHKCTIDRIDTNGDYCPENCKWSDAKEQSNNRRSNRLYTYNGKTQNIRQWADEYDISYKMLIQRLNRNWTIERAITEPADERRRVKNGKHKSPDQNLERKTPNLYQ